MQTLRLPTAINRALRLQNLSVLMGTAARGIRLLRLLYQYSESEYLYYQIVWRALQPNGTGALRLALRTGSAIVDLFVDALRPFRLD